MNLLITGAYCCTEDELNRISSIGYKLHYMKDEHGDLPIDPSLVDCVICNGLFAAHHIEKFSNLKFIQLTSAGLDRVPMKYIEKHKIKVFNARGVYSVPMAEFAISGILDLYKRKFDFYERQKAHIWNKIRNLQELFHKTVCIIGCGSVGQECAKRLKAFDCRIIGIDIKPFDSPVFDKMKNLNEIKSILPISDIVILSLPLTDLTNHLFNDNVFRLMKKNSIIVNISRGAIIDENSLVSSLKGHLYGAVLDVFEEEPLDSNSVLWDMDNVIITPHNSFVSADNCERLNAEIFKNLTDAYSNE